MEIGRQKITLFSMRALFTHIKMYLTAFRNPISIIKYCEISVISFDICLRTFIAMNEMNTTTQRKVQGDQDHFYAKEMLISLSILKLHKNP